MELHNSIASVTGAGKGIIGNAIAEALAEHGAMVGCAGRHHQNVESTASSYQWRSLHVVISRHEFAVRDC